MTAHFTGEGKSCLANSPACEEGAVAWLASWRWEGATPCWGWKAEHVLSDLGRGRGGRGCWDVGGGACAQRRDQVPPLSALSLTDRVSRRGKRAATERLVKSVLGTNRSGTFSSPTGSQACGSSDS